MVLVDTSVWIAHFRRNDPALVELLNPVSVIMHPFVLGELACGNFKNREAVLTNLQELPDAIVAAHDEVLRLLEYRKLWGRGIGWVDAHLMVSALLSNSALWTLDEKLIRAAEDAGVKKYRAA